jgi:hypothetical protein
MNYPKPHNLDVPPKEEQSPIQKTFPSFFGQFYMSQGFREKGVISNDCGPTSLAMIINVILAQENIQNLSLRKENIIYQSRFHFWDRIPTKLPTVGGATAPWGIVSAFNQWMLKLGLSGVPSASAGRTAYHHQEHHLRKIYFCLKVWKNGGAHWVDIIDFSSEDNMVYTLDPNPYLVHLPQNRRVQKESWDNLHQTGKEENRGGICSVSTGN